MPRHLLEFMGRLESKMSEIKASSYITDNYLPGQAHFTKNDNYALKKCSKKGW
jgi:hypothetical protein